MIIDTFFQTLEESTLLIIVLALVVGLLVGSFLNVVIYRLPIIMKSKWYGNIQEILYDAFQQKEPTGIPFVDRGCRQCQDGLAEEDFNPNLEVKGYSYLAWPPSSCPNCGYKIKSFQNIPVLSWLFLRGKCAGCANPISIQYPLIELLTGVLSALVAWKFGFSFTTIAYFVFIWALIAATFIDFKHYLLPDEITLPLIWLGMILAYFGIIPVEFKSSFFGAIFGYLFFWVVFWIFKLLFKKDGMGYGDFKLLSMLGAWFGVSAVFPIVLLSTVFGSVIGVSLILFYKHAKEKPIPFGPYLALAGVIYLFFEVQIQNLFPVL